MSPPGLSAGSGAGGEKVRADGTVASAYDWELSCSRALRQGPLDQASVHSGWVMSSRAGGGVRPMLTWPCLCDPAQLAHCPVFL